MSAVESQSFITPEQIYEKLRTIAQERLSLTPDQIQALRAETSIAEGLQMDSLAQVTFISAVEDEFGVVIDFEDRQYISTIQDLVTMIYKRLTTTG